MIMRRFDDGFRVALVVLLATFALSVGAQTGAEGERIGLAVSDPRAYGHVVGDRITRGVRLDLPAGYRLERASLPEKGAQNYWLDLVDVTVETDAERGGRVEVALDYQLFYAPLQASRRELPGFTVRAADESGRRITATVPGFALTMSPIIELQPEAEFGSEDNDLMLDDEPPALRDVATPRGAATAATVLLLLALLGWAWAADRLPGRERGPFARAAATLGRWRGRDRHDALPEALRTIHRAFDATAGRALFAEDVDAFIERHPAFADRREDIATFFDFSRRFFFSAYAVDCSRAHVFDELVRLVRDCRRRERRT